MSYSAEISRVSPGCFIFLLDQSASMSENWSSAPGKTKADGVATIINRLLQNLVIECAKSEGIRDYFDISVIGYGQNVGPAFMGSLAGQRIVPISSVGQNPARLEERVQKVDDGIGGLVEHTVKFPVWLDPAAGNGTPMCKALNDATEIAREWAQAHPDSFPPIVINITDGESTDGNPISAADALKSVGTNDGATLLLNIHLSGNALATPIQFPGSSQNLPDEASRTLFQMSSVLPQYMKSQARNGEYQVSDDSRGFMYQADSPALITFLQIGTRPSNLR